MHIARKPLAKLGSAVFLFVASLCLALTNTSSASAAVVERIYLQENPEGTSIMNIDGSSRAHYSSGIQRSISPDGKQQVFAHLDDEGNYNVHAANSFDTWQDNITKVFYPNDEVVHHFPIWMPDSHGILFRDQTANQLYITDREGGDLQVVPSSADLYPHSVSTDGNSFLFEATEPNGLSSGIGVADIDGTSKQFLLSTTQHNERAPEWSPDGTKIAWIRQQCDLCTGTNDVMVADADMSNQQVVASFTQGYAMPRNVTWSPDGENLAYAASGEENSVSPPGVYVVDLDTLSSERIYHNDEIDNDIDNLDWSLVVLDLDPPIITGVPDREPDFGTWYREEVEVSWDEVDPEPSSGPASDAGTVLVYEEGVRVYTSLLSCDPLSQCATGSIEIKLDMSNPELDVTVTPPAPQVNGWYNTNVDVFVQCDDEVSGIYHCSENYSFTNDAVDQQQTFTATDNAGNTVQEMVTNIDLDKTAPIVSNVTLSGLVNLPLTGNVLLGSTTNVTAQVTDNLSGVVEVEYYIDTDPGVGNGTGMNLSGSTATANGVPVGNILAGQHTLYVRGLDTAGNWSQPIGALFIRLL